MTQFRNHDAFTGLEAAIVLIAFVVVAAVFSYVVLGAGFFTTQKAQATIHTGVQQASSSFEVVGNVFGCALPTHTTNLDYVNMTLALTAGGTPIDMSQMVVSYNDGSTRLPNLTYDGENCAANVFTGALTPGANVQGHWCIAAKINNSTVPSELLGPNEQYVVAIQMPTTTTVNTQFTINLQPAAGAVLPLTRTVPGAINPVQMLY